MRAFALLAVFSLFLAGCSGAGADCAIKGKVAIGPLCPVEPCSLSPEQIAKAYDSRNVVVYGKSGNVVREIAIAPDGSYFAYLGAGEYVVDIRGSKMDRSPDVPRAFKVAPGETYELDISIDTGIR